MKCLPMLVVIVVFFWVGCATTGGGKWYATCESGHVLWDGPDQDTFAKAQEDATAHDKKNHEGRSTASVLQHPF